MTFRDGIEWMGIAFMAVAFVVEMAAVIQRALAARYGWQRWPTISMVFRDDGKQWTAIVFGWGLLAGHWWGPFPRWFVWDYWIWIATAGALLVRDLVNRFDPEPLAKRWLFALLLAGVVQGALFWSSGGLP